MPTKPALPTIKQTTTPNKKVQFALDIEQPGSPTSVDQHPSMLLDEATTILLFGDCKANGIQCVTFKAIDPNMGLPAEHKAQPALVGQENTATKSDDWHKATKMSKEPTQCTSSQCMKFHKDTNQPAVAQSVQIDSGSTCEHGTQPGL
jgi:hypothetical protein